MIGPASSNITIYLILLIAILLVALDSLQLYNIFSSWKMGMTIAEPFFTSCVKYNLLSKTALGIFSFLASCSLVILCILFVYDADYFVNKIFYSYIRLNYKIFGPTMLCFSIIGLYYYNEICYICYDKKNLNAKKFSLNNCFSLLTSFIVSLAITIIAEIYMAFFFLINSITSKPGGYRWIKRVFYHFALKRE